jgi:hypothetical protein
MASELIDGEPTVRSAPIRVPTQHGEIRHAVGSATGPFLAAISTAVIVLTDPAIQGRMP